MSNTFSLSNLYTCWFLTFPSTCMVDYLLFFIMFCFLFFMLEVFFSCLRALTVLMFKVVVLQSWWEVLKGLSAFCIMHSGFSAEPPMSVFFRSFPLGWPESLEKTLSFSCLEGVTLTASFLEAELGKRADGSNIRCYIFLYPLEFSMAHLQWLYWCLLVQYFFFTL